MPVSHARAAVSSLLVMLADITDPRDPRGVRHPLVAVPGVAVAATLAGAASYRELGSVAAGLPRELLSLPGARWDLAGLVFIAPSAGTLRRVLIALDAGELDRVTGAWLREQANVAELLAAVLPHKGRTTDPVRQALRVKLRLAASGRLTPPFLALCMAGFSRLPADPVGHGRARASTTNDLLGGWWALHRGRWAIEIQEQAVR